MEPVYCEFILTFSPEPLKLWSSPWQSSREYCLEQYIFIAAASYLGSSEESPTTHKQSKLHL